MKTAAAYIRVSTEDQIEFSPDSQKKKILEYAEAHDLSIPEEYIYVDEGISGRTAERRPSFMEMIKTAKAKPSPFDVILLWKFSRFARNRQDAIFYKSMLRKECGVEVVSVTEQLSGDPTSILVEALLEAMDEYYSINLGQEVKRGMAEKFSRGGIVTIASFGYNVVNGKYEIDPDEAPIVKMIFEEFVYNMMPYKQIAQKLNAIGARTKRGNLFEIRTVQYILLNPVYIGKIRWTQEYKNLNDRYHECEDTEVVDSDHEPIISKELFEAARQRVNSIRRSHKEYARCGPADFMLKGLVRCSDCGSTLVLSSKKTGLQCHKYARGQCATSHYISLGLINNAVINKIESDLGGGELRVSVKTINRMSDTLAVNARITQEKKKLKRARDAYEAGIDTIEEYKERKEQILAQIEKLQSEIQPRATDGRSTTKNIRSTMKNVLPQLMQTGISEAAKNEMLKSFISEIVFNRKENTIQIHYYIDTD